MFTQDIKGNKYLLDSGKSNNTAIKSINNRKLRQTTLCPNTAPKKKTKSDSGDNIESNAFLLPNPQETFCSVKQSLPEAPSVSRNVLEKPENDDRTYILLMHRRKQIAIIGEVNYCLGIHKTYSGIEAICDIFGILLKVMTGKHKNEVILLLRSRNGGPVLQAIYYEFNGVTNNYNTGSHIRVVGRFINDNSLHTFRVYQVQQKTCEMEALRRIQNVQSFALSRKEK